MLHAIPVRSLLKLFFWTLLGCALALYAWLWFAGPADIVAARGFRSAAPCGQGDPHSCTVDIGGVLIAKREIHRGRTPTAYEATVRTEDGSRPTFTGLLHWRTGNFDGLHPGEKVTLRYFHDELTNVKAPEGDFLTNANPEEQAFQDEALFSTLEWTLPIPLLPVGLFLLATRPRRSGYPG